MRKIQEHRCWKRYIAVSAQLVLTASLVMAVEPSNSKTFASGEKAKVRGVILSRDGQSLKVRADDDTIDTIDLTNDTKIRLRKSWASKKNEDPAALVPGLHIEAQGKGNDKGDLVAERVTFDPNSARATRQIDARVSPLEARTNSVEGRAGQLEGRAGQLENRAGQIEGRQSELENTEKQTQQQVAQVRSTAEQANQGVNATNQRIGNLDNYTPKETATVYFRVGSAVLSPQAKQDLDNLAQQAKNEKGFVIEIAGFADTTGNAAANQQLSERRAQAVTEYLEEHGDIPIHRILPASGLGTTHEAADNKTRDGRKLNRRVEVKVLVNQGLVSENTGSSSNMNNNTGNGQTQGNTTNPNSTTQGPSSPQQQ